MAEKPSPASLSELAAAQRTVFIATSLGTHLVVPFSDLDTVFDLKGKLERQHLLCFAEIGKIVVRALKVRRKKSFYHVPDIVFVKNAFDGVVKSYFLCADVSRIEEHNEHQLRHTPVSENLLTYTGNTGNNPADGLALSLYGSLDQGVSDPNKRTEVFRNHVECKNDTSKHGIAEKIVVLENDTFKCDIVKHCNMSVEEALQSNHTATRKRKLDEVGAACLEENIDSDRETSKPGTLSQNSYRDKDKSEHAVIDVLTAKRKDDHNLSANGLRSRKMRKRNSSQNKPDEVVAPVASSAKDVLGESSLVITGNQKNLTGEPERAIALPGQIADAACGISSKEKHFESIQEVQKYVPSTIDADVTEANAGEVGAKGVASEKEATRGAKKMRNSKDTSVGDIEGGSLVFKKPHNLQRDVRVSEKENFDTAEVETVEEERALPESKDSRMQLKKCESPDQDKTEVNSMNVGVTQNGTIAPRKFSEKRKSERTKDLDSETSRSVTEGVEDLNYDISREHHKAVSVKHPSITDEEESIYSGLKEKKMSKVSAESTFMTRDAEKITGNVMEIKQQPNKHQDNEENVEKQSRKKSKKKRKSPAENLLDLQAQDQVVTSQNSVPPSDDNNRQEAVRFSRSATEDVKVSEPETSRENFEAVSGKHSSKEEENNNSETQGKDVLKASAEGIFMTRETDEIVGNVMENKRQRSKHQDNEENVEKESRKKSKKKRKSPAENLLDLQAQDQVITGQNSVPPSDNNKKKEAVRLSRSATEDVKGSEPETSRENHEAVSGKHPSNEEENNNSETQGKDVLKASAEGTFVTQETDKIIGNVMENKQQRSNHQDNEENVEKQSRKKSKKKRKSPAENLLDLQAQDQVVTGQNSVPPSVNNNRKEAVRLSRSATEDVKGFKPETSHENFEAVSGQHPSNEEENNSSETRGKDVLKASAGGTSMTRETDEITGIAMENKQHTSKHQDNEENVEKQLGKKSKKKRKSPAENLLDLQAQDQVVTGQNSVPPSDNNNKKEAGRLSRSATEDVKGSEPETSHENHEAVSGQHPSNEEENNNSETQGKDVLKASAEGTFTTLETDEIIGNVMKNKQRRSKHQDNEENVEKQSRKRSKKKRKSPAENLPDLQAEDEDVTGQNSVLPSDNNKEEDVRISRSATEDVKGSEPEISHESHEAVSGKHPRNKDKEENNNSETQGKDVWKASAEDTFSSRKTDEVSGNEVENVQHTRKHQGNEENVEEKSRKKSRKKRKSPAKNLPDMQAQDQDATGQNSVPLSDNKKEAVASPSLQKKDQLEKPAVSKQLNESKTETENLGVENDPLPPQPNSEVNKSAKQPLSLDNNHKGRPVAANKQGNSSANHLQGSSSKDKSDDSMCQPEKKLPKASKGEAKALVSNTSTKSIRAETIRQTAVSVSRTEILPEKSIDAGSVSTPSFNGSKISLGGKDIMGNKRSSGVEGSRVANRILFGKANGEVVASSEDKKLVATPGAIFNDDSSGSSEDDGEVSDSDSSTKTPSDHSLSSEYSDGESNATNVNSSQKGSFTPDQTKGQRKNIIKSCSSIAKDLSFDKILRSSSRFKQAHLTASQMQLEDEESQPVEFVPDGLADT